MKKVERVNVCTLPFRARGRWVWRWLNVATNTTTTLHRLVICTKVDESWLHAYPVHTLH